MGRTGRSDNCPTVPNPDQANRDGDKYGDACDNTGCHPACATGCTKPNDITTCTTPFFGGKTRSCKRCTKGYHGEAGKPGCVPGAPRGKCAESPSPVPTPAPGPGPAGMHLGLHSPRQESHRVYY